jgi:Protein of unknown function (DUF3237)
MNLALDFVFLLRISVAPALELGETERGRRRIIPITGGTITGPRLAGRVLAGGADWQTIRPDGTAELDARYTLEATDGALISVKNQGLRHGAPEIVQRLIAGESVDPKSYYFRTTPVFETAAATHHWLMCSVFVATGVRHPDLVEIRVFAVL